MLDLYFIAALVLGLLAHLFGTLVEDSARLQHRATFTEFRNLHPWQLPLSLTLSIGAYIVFYKMGELNVISALAAGYMGDSIVKKAMGKVQL